jgi:SAM-dependent methyltransferase
VRLASLLLFAAAAWAQVADQANQQYRTSDGRLGMLASLDAPTRAEQIRAGAIIKLIGLQRGAAVADLGTGAGIMLPTLSWAVGDAGRVYAQDIFPEFLDRARQKAAEGKMTNVTFVQGSDRDPKLPAASCDWILTVDAYHHFDYPAEMLAGIARALRPGGQFAVVDFYRRLSAMDTPGQALFHIRLDRDDVIKEIESNGFRFVRTEDTVPGKQYLAIFAPR